MRNHTIEQTPRVSFPFPAWRLGDGNPPSGASNRATADSRLRRPLNNLFEGMRIEPGARKMNGGTMGRASQNNHSA